jgi:hypothetical protein
MDAGHNKPKGKQMTQNNFLFEWHNPSRGGSQADANTIRITVTKSKDSRSQLSIRIYGDVMSAMRWVCGDRVSVGFNFNSKLIAIKRNSAHGYLLSASADTKEKRTENEGTHSIAVVKMQAPDQLAEAIDAPLVVDFGKCTDANGVLIVPFSEG